jgi:hypothetical protein
MSRELLWLTLTVGLTALIWVPYILDRIMVRGVMGAMANPTKNDKPHSQWAVRMMFAHANAVENLVIFAPLVLILDIATSLVGVVWYGALGHPIRSWGASTPPSMSTALGGQGSISRRRGSPAAIGGAATPACRAGRAEGRTRESA